MPKASFASKDTYEVKAGFQEGWFEITDAKVKVFQFPPNKETGDQTAPFLAQILSIQKTDEKGRHTDDDALETILKIEKDLGKMRPGNAENRDDDEPEDLGDELDTEGNCIFVEDGSKINNKSRFAVFMKSLEEKGFKPDILACGFSPDLVGLKGFAKSISGGKFPGSEKEATYLVVDQITQFPYEKKGKATSAASSKSAAPAKKTAAPVKKDNAAAEVEEESGDDAADEAATAILVELAADLSGETKDQKKVYTMAYSRLVKNKDRDKKLDKSVQELLKKEDWLAEKAEEIGYSYEDGSFTFN